ncbi:MAG: hypothetical protein R6U56_00475 [Opitutales bacterium]
MHPAFRLVDRCLLFAAALLILTACDPDPGSNGRSTSSSSQPEASAPAKSPGLAVRSDYYSADVEAGLQAEGLSPGDFKKGQRQYELYCLNCHAAPKRAGGSAPGERLAPPAFAVADHYRRAIPDTRERIEAIAKFTAKPNEEDALMPGAIRRFGLMSPMPLSEEQLERIAIFLATAEFAKPGWYDAHYEEEHGPEE